MPKTPEVFAKDYAALSHTLDAAALQLKAAEQARAQHDQALRQAAQALSQRVAALRAGGRAGADLKTDPEAQRLVGGLDERLARAEAERQRVHGLATGAWAQLHKTAAALEKELAADILARQKSPASKAGPGQKALAELLHLQADTRKKLAPRRAALLAGQRALQFVDDPQYFRAQRDQALAAAFGAAPAVPATAKPAATQPAKTPAPTGVPKSTGGAPKSAGGPAASIPAASTAAASPARPSPATVTPSSSPPVSVGSGGAPPVVPAPLPAEPLLTAAAFKKAGREARLLVTGIRASAGVARRATRARKLRQAETARATAERRLRSLEVLVKQYEQARAQTGDEAILALRDGRQLLRGIEILVVVRERARKMVGRLSPQKKPVAGKRGKPARRR